jgi:hypothetical protein
MRPESLVDYFLASKEGMAISEIPNPHGNRESAIAVVFFRNINQ